MLHDKNGVELKRGDMVLIPCEIDWIGEHPHYCNLTLKTVEPMFPDHYHTTISLNAKQVLKAVRQSEPSDRSGPLPAGLKEIVPIPCPSLADVRSGPLAVPESVTGSAGGGALTEELEKEAAPALATQASVTQATSTVTSDHPPSKSRRRF